MEVQGPRYRSSIKILIVVILLTAITPVHSIFGSGETAGSHEIVGESSVAISLHEDLEREKSAAAEETVIRFGPRSAWSANTRTGRTVGGTWTGEIDLSTGTATGTWTVRDTAGQVVMHGTWSAAKEAREWRGAWRALVVGQTKERSGTWSSEMPLPPDSQLGSLFERAEHQTVSGTWRSAGQSGAWSIRSVR